MAFCILQDILALKKYQRDVTDMAPITLRSDIAFSNNSHQANLSTEPTYFQYFFHDHTTVLVTSDVDILGCLNAMPPSNISTSNLVNVLPHIDANALHIRMQNFSTSPA